MEAGLYWNSPDMPPFAIAGDPRSRGQRPDDEICISLEPTGEFAVDEIWREYMLQKYAPTGAW